MQTVLVTGANRGIGLEFTKQYLEQGAKVFACCRAPEKASELEQLKKDYKGLSTLSIDLTNEGSIEAAAKSVQEPIDLLINNAGIMSSRDEDLDNISADSLIKTFKVNAVGSTLVLSTFREHVAKSEGKQVVTLSSRMGSMSDNVTGGYFSYRASICALNALMKTSSIELEADGIKLLMLHPGWVKTDMGTSSAILSVEESVSDMIKVIKNHKIYPNGAFVAHSSELLPW